MNSAIMVSKVWSFFNTLRDDGVGYVNCLEQLRSRKTRLSAGDPLIVEGNGPIEQIGRVAIRDHKGLAA